MGWFDGYTKADERHWQQQQAHNRRMKQLEFEAAQTQVDSAKLDNDRKRIELERARYEVWVAYQDVQQRGYLVESARLELELKRLDVQLKQRELDQGILYPNQIGAYPVVLNPLPEWNNLLYLPGANQKYVAPEPEPQPVKSFSDLLQDGTINYAQSQNKIVLGYSQEGIRMGTWLDLYSCGIGGVSGSGKTTTVRFLLFQAILQGSQLVMVDPHINSVEESLAAQFRNLPVHLLEPCNHYPTQVMQRINFLDKELQRREDKNIKTPHIIFVIDEFNKVMARGDEETADHLRALLDAIEQEGRKFGIFAMIIGQRWSAQDIGSASIRSALAATLVHRFTDVDQAKKLIGDARSANKVLGLANGHYLLRTTDGKLTEMVTPNTVEGDGEIVRKMLETSSETRPETSQFFVESSIETEPLKPVGNQPETELKLDPETRSDSALLALGQRIVSMFAQGMNKKEIMLEIWHVNVGGGADYKRAQLEFNAAMQAVNDHVKASVIP